MTFRKYLPTATETGPHQGLLSTFAEWHGVAIGFLCYLVNPASLAAVIGYGVGRGSVRGGSTAHPLSGHAVDAARELAYVALGVALALLVKVVVPGVV